MKKGPVPIRTGPFFVGGPWLAVIEAEHAGDCAAEKYYEPAAVDGQADPMEDAIDRLRTSHERGGQGKNKVKCHPHQGGNAAGIVPLGRLAVQPLPLPLKAA